MSEPEEKFPPSVPEPEQGPDYATLAAPPLGAESDRPVSSDAITSDLRGVDSTHTVSDSELAPGSDEHSVVSDDLQGLTDPPLDRITNQPDSDPTLHDIRLDEIAAGLVRSRSAAPSNAPHVLTPVVPELPTDASIGGIHLASVAGLQDLPEEAQHQLVQAARLETLGVDEEINDFGVALVLDGWVTIMPTIADAACAHATKGAVVFTAGTLSEGIALRVVSGQDDTVIAVWDGAALEQATQDCPWVADELRVVADRFQALAGVTMGALGDRLDDSLRAMITDRCEVRTLLPYEVLVEKGNPLPGMHVVGGGRVEIIVQSDDGGEVEDELGPGDFLFAPQVLSAGKATATARAGKGGALVLFADRMTTHELLVSVPPLLEILAG